MRTLTGEQRDEIVRRYRKREPTKVIAADFGVTDQYVSELSLRRGAESRHPLRRGVLTIKLRAAELAELRKQAKEQSVRPDVIGREAIAAYLGLSR